MADGPLPTGPVQGRTGDRGPGPHRAGPPARRRARPSRLPDGRWCARHLLVRLHAASRGRRRRQVEPASIGRLRALPGLLAARGRRAPRPRVGPGCLAVIEQLQGLEVAAGEWERHVLPARVAGYDPRWLDELCLAGEVAWGRLTPRPTDRRRRAGDAEAVGDGHRGRRGSATPSPATPAGHRHATRPDLDAGGRAGRPGAWPSRRPAPRPTSWPRCGPAGPGSAPSWPSAAGRLGPRSTRGSGTWWPGASSPPTPSRPSARSCRPVDAGRPRRPGTGAAGGPRTPAGPGRERCRRGPLVAAARARPWDGGPHGGPAGRGGGRGGGLATAGPLGRRDLGALGRESYRVPWRDVVRALRRLEARGLVLGGRFVAGISGEQYALPEAASLLADVRRDPGRGPT